MRALGLLLAAVVLAACASPPVTVDLPPTAHQGGAEPTSGPSGLGALANNGHCWFLRDDAPARARHRPPSRHPHRASSPPAPQPQPSGRPTATPAPAIAVPTSATTCGSDEHPNAS